MIQKTTEFEKYLGFSMMIFLIGQIIKHLSPESSNVLMIYLMCLSGLFATIKIIRFYKFANKKINTIWLLSLAVTFTGIVFLLLKYRIGLGIAAAGSVAFWLTWHYSFLANRPDIR